MKIQITRNNFPELEGTIHIAEIENGEVVCEFIGNVSSEAEAEALIKELYGEDAQ